MIKDEQTNITIVLVPPNLYEPKDPEWQEICEKLYNELKISLSQQNFDVTIKPGKEQYQLEKGQHPKAGEWLELFNTIVVSFGETAALITALKYLFDKLIELQKDRNETERAREFEVTIGENSFRFKGINTQEITNVIQQLEKTMAAEPAEILPEKDPTEALPEKKNDE